MMCTGPGLALAAGGCPVVVGAGSIPAAGVVVPCAVRAGAEAGLVDVAGAGVASTAPRVPLRRRGFLPAFLPGAVVGWVERVVHACSLACGAPLRARLGGALTCGGVPSLLRVCGV